MQHAVKTLLVAAVATVSRALVVQPARPHHPLRRCGSPVLCEPVERTLDAEFDVIDTRYFGPALSPATWARIGRDKLRALVTDRKSEANFAWHTINSPGRVLFSERSALGNGLVTITAQDPSLHRRAIRDSFVRVDTLVGRLAEEAVTHKSQIETVRVGPSD